MSEKPVKSKRIKTVQVIKQQDEPIENKPKIKIDTKTLRELDVLVNSLNKKFGDNAVTKGVSFTSSKIERIPTGSISLDIALGGGIPKGRYTEISGGLSTSKSTQMLHIIRNAQEMGLICALIDVEATTDEAYIRQIGVDFDSLIYSTPDSTEEAAQLILDLQKSGIVHFAVLDSLAALSPNTEMQKDMDETMRMGITPNLLNEFFRKYQMNNNRLVRENKQPFTLICLNQLREKIGTYGDNEFSPGGRGKGFTATVELRFRKGDWIVEGKGDDKEIVGQVVKFKIEKNKTGVRMRTGEFDFYFSDNAVHIEPGYNDIFKEIIICAVEWNIIEVGGSWFTYEGKKYHGQESLVSALRNDPALIEKLKNQILFLSNKKG